MKLAADIFEKITSSVAVTGRDEARPADRRAQRVRLGSQLAVYRWDQPAETISAQVRDMSIGGVGVIHTERVALDERLVIRFPMPAGQSVLVAGIVVYWEPLADGTFAIGVQFERMVTEQEWAAHAQAPVVSAGVIGRITHAFQRRMKKAS
jgi:hypothetical protein